MTRNPSSSTILRSLSQALSAMNNPSPSDIPLFTFNDIIFMILNFMDSYSKIKCDSLILKEKQRYRDNNLCLYYINLIHKIFEYPHASKRNPSRFLNETQYSLNITLFSIILLIIIINENIHE